MDTDRRHTAIRLPEGSWWDWEVISWTPVELRLAAGRDLTYSHGLELVFGDPVYVSCPAMFQDPVFREPAADEVRRVVEGLGEQPSVLVAFKADGGGPAPVSCLIAAERVEVVRGVVPRAEGRRRGQSVP
ncbi:MULTISPECIES: hypothetical protein [unclassified Streptomyces]|uniref:hypothetical protein n=1 Tax=unclassified Streptomyces TaxID=2593676 RepID=UPI002E159AAA|nr:MULTISPECIES: hypothetical protein [unclassified Streptomyces]WSR24308.1 hypothetical protein OG573_38025 [Streptomyces sp. NBC_01205]